MKFFYRLLLRAPSRPPRAWTWAPAPGGGRNNCCSLAKPLLINNDNDSFCTIAPSRSSPCFEGLWILLLLLPLFCPAWMAPSPSWPICISSLPLLPLQSPLSLCLCPHGAPFLELTSLRPFCAPPSYQFKLKHCKNLLPSPRRAPFLELTYLRPGSKSAPEHLERCVVFLVDGSEAAQVRGVGWWVGGWDGV